MLFGAGRMAGTGGGGCGGERMAAKGCQAKGMAQDRDGENWNKERAGRALLVTYQSCDCFVYIT